MLEAIGSCCCCSFEAVGEGEVLEGAAVGRHLDVGRRQVAAGSLSAGGCVSEGGFVTSVD